MAGCQGIGFAPVALKDRDRPAAILGEKK